MTSIGDAVISTDAKGRTTFLNPVAGPDDSTVQIVTGATEAAASLSVHNTGAHIAEELLQTIFEPVRRGTEGIDRAARSVGAPGAGTTFPVRLPLSRA